MKTKKTIYFTVAFAVIIGSFFVLNKYNHPEVNINKMSTDIISTAKLLTQAFTANEILANKKYVNKVIETKGIVKQITFINHRNTIILYGNTNDTNIICDLDKNQLEEIKKLMPDQEIKIKGICKGFIKDVVLLNCILINTQAHE